MTIHVTKPVTLEGFQNIARPSQKFNNFSLKFITDDDELVERLEEERERCLEWARGKVKNPKRVTVRPEPWIEHEEREEFFVFKFSWKPGDNRIPVFVDSEGTPLPEPLDLRTGSIIRASFEQSPSIMPDGYTIGSKLKLVGVQIIKAVLGNGISDAGSTPEEVAAMFGKVDGYSVSAPNPTAPEEEDEDDVPF
jgi:hypothetical protein